MKTRRAAMARPASAPSSTSLRMTDQSGRSGVSITALRRLTTSVIVRRHGTASRLCGFRPWTRSHFWPIDRVLRPVSVGLA